MLACILSLLLCNTTFRRRDNLKLQACQKRINYAWWVTTIVLPQNRQVDGLKVISFSEDCIKVESKLQGYRLMAEYL